MTTHMAFEQGFNVLQTGASFISSMQEAKSKRAWQKYNNAMTRLSGAQNKNAIVTNENMAIERDVVQQFNIERSAYTTAAEVEVIAAAAGSVGRSVNQTMFAVNRNAAQAQHNRMSDLQAQLNGFDNQKRSTDFQVSQQLDYTFIADPSPLSAVMGLYASDQQIQQRYDALYT